jgi:hypothetical protein
VFKIRLNDGSICESCKHFEHECNLEERCIENCSHANKEVQEIFVDDYEYEKVVLECKGYDKR